MAGGHHFCSASLCFALRAAKGSIKELAKKRENNNDNNNNK